MSRIRLSLILVPLAMIAVAVGMHRAVDAQRSVATRAAERTDAAARLLTALLDQETAVRGFLLTGQEDFLEPYRRGLAAAADAGGDIRGEADGDPATLRLLGRHVALERSWNAKARASIARRRAIPGFRPSLRRALSRKRLMDDLRAVNARLQRRLRQRRDAELHAAGARATVLIVVLAGLLGAAGALLLRGEAARRRRADRLELAYRASQREFADVLQVVRSEPEAHDVLKRHLDATIAGAHATVLQRNTSDHATTAGHTRCEPLLVGGQVIGSVLVETPVPLSDDDERRLTESVAQAAPVLANLRNLALAERRAETDALTGLANRRAIGDRLRQLGAHANRTGEPLTVMSIDLDHFKDINDRFGHDMGDTVLAQVAAALTASVRGSDLVGRLGGEEFVVIAPATDLDGARTLADNLRTTLQREHVAGLDRSITASIGVAVRPDHGLAAEALLRASDRALYVAKAAGRNRVEVARTAPADIAV
ncbi:MAG TPA: diguanylate cyclase [Baekduia sp.]|nr:diguanylate cyclase [Baekduia sp.]